MFFKHICPLLFLFLSQLVFVDTGITNLTFGLSPSDLEGVAPQILALSVGGKGLASFPNQRRTKDVGKCAEDEGIKLKTQLAIVQQEFISPKIENFDCHSPTIVETSDSSILVAWTGGIGKGKCDFLEMTENVGVWMAFSKDGKWSVPKQIVNKLDTKCWNPVFSQLPDGQILLFYKVGPSPLSWYGAMKRSYDQGVSWEEEEVLPAGILGPVKNKPLLIGDAFLVCGSSWESGYSGSPFQATACWIETLSLKDGKWKKSGPLEIPNQRFGALQPAIYQDKLGVLHLLCRDRAHQVGGVGFLWQSVSSDQGCTWAPLTPTELPNPDSAIDIVSLQGGRIMLIYNPSHDYRFPLSIAFSENGKFWHRILDLECTRAEYPSAIQTSDGCVHVVYSFEDSATYQRRIKHAILIGF